MTRVLTKSRYKLAVECSAKLFYTGKKDIYYDSKLDNEFLMALAEGGFQVGELAKLYYPGGVNIESLDYETALQQTAALLKEENVIIYEGAFRYEDLFIRADIIVKEGNKIKLLEVKAKSIDGEETFTTKNGIKSKWRPYLDDVAFQKHVIIKSYPQFEIEAYLFLSDKSKTASVDGLNQLFFVYEDQGRYQVKRSEKGDYNNLGTPLLTAFCVDKEVELIWNEPTALGSFEDQVKFFSAKYAVDHFIDATLGGQCTKCEFKLPADQKPEGKKSGFHECWKKAGVTDEILSQPLVLELWDFRKKPEYVKAARYLLKDLERADLEPKTKGKKDSVPYLSRIDRQELQIQKCRDNDPNHFLDIEGLAAEMKQWKFPLHFIDFETTAVAIPFNAGKRPYEQTAFQFSHHTVDENGGVVHAHEWINTQRGVFPNFEFVRALKESLSGDDGTIFRYAVHENTILNVIYRQLQDSAETDKHELCEWIKTITHSSSSSSDQWRGERDMVDLREMVLRYYYHPLTKGSNSIKFVLPAILSCSDYLQEKYSSPVYGNEIPSKNFKAETWIKRDETGHIINPYKLLPCIHNGIDNESLDEVLTDEESGIADGGAAMIAYARMQFSDMNETERERIMSALLRYCELDTLAMVMIYEAWREWCK
ncbi:MAG: hypothetical protein JWN76_2465 [Chitinophagaceae bacterium]|nr:hypothetical protein [Chitinophagaceae bacterium]